MNYTRPNDIDHKDNPSDWLFGALAFSRALGKILKEKEGIVVHIVGDMKDLTEYEKIIIYNSNEMIHIMECTEDLPDGQLIWMHDDENSEV